MRADDSREGAVCRNPVGGELTKTRGKVTVCLTLLLLLPAEAAAVTVLRAISALEIESSVLASSATGNKSARGPVLGMLDG